MKTKTEWLADVANATRIIGIVPRVKAKANQEPSPTTLAIYDCGAGAFRPKFALADEQSELDFVLGCMPVKWRAVAPGENLSGFKEHHIRMKKDPADKAKSVPDEVPTAYEGLKKGDVLVSCLGGSGDYYNFALSRQAEEIGALVLRCPPFRLKEFRDKIFACHAEKNGALLHSFRNHSISSEQFEKESVALRATSKELDEMDDSFVLVQAVKAKPDEFYPVFVRERLFIWMRVCYRRRIDIMKDRIACEQRLHQRFIGQIFCSAEGKYPEGAVEKEFEGVVANDAVLDALLREEKLANTALAKACDTLPVYTEVFGQIEGVGPSIASRLMDGIQDIRRFETKWKLRKFCGVHCLTDGRFPRRRSGEVANWNPACRQALFLLGDQFNRRPGTVWGDKLRANKALYRIQHPAPVEVSNGDGKKVKKYTDGHIHKMALWKTLGEFVEWLFEEWWKLERTHQQG